MELTATITATGIQAPIEYNLSCPNVEGSNIQEALAAMEFALYRGHTVIAKLGPVQWMPTAKECYKHGIRHFHCCNTIPTPGGGISGKPLKQYSLWCIQDLRQQFGDTIKITGGGGVTRLPDLGDYIIAGANRVSVASMLFNPLNWWKIKYFAEYMR